MTARPIANDGAGWGPASDAGMSNGDRALAVDLLDEIDLRCRGPRRAATVKELAVRLGVSDRKIRTLVTSLRHQGHPICATPDTGYFWPETREQAEHTLAFLSARVRSTTEIRDGIVRGLDDLFGGNDQLRLAA